ncbi:uncharacterized protein si:dkey-121a11.3 [Lates calcarifer]|uniref:Uncharacterized protein si:dkey-121a11.3 n=1 Tax=Lates calcarifer TaxID=8187 RepID=A0AAJ7PCP6_LATCA|nr:uncharacterized protein si:dkey-121a11.3 [Lates calcarifer]
MRSRTLGAQVMGLTPPPTGSASCSSDEDSPVSMCVSAGEAESQTDLDSLVSFSLDSSSLCSAPKNPEHTWTCVTPGGDQVSLQEEQRRSSLLSLTQKVQVNRRILQNLLTNQRTHLDDSQSESREYNNTGSVVDESEILLRGKNNQSLFVCARLPRQQQCEDGGRMKRRCVPLRGDHNLLTPDTHTLSGVRLRPVVQVRFEDVVSQPGFLSDSSSSDLAVGSSRRHPAASPTRRLRFEDETETEAESRYLERQRQRRWVGQRGTGVLVSKPDLNLYMNSRTGVRFDADRQQRGQLPAGGPGVVGQCESCVRTSSVNVNLRLHPPVPDDRGRSLYRPHLNLRTEPIRETYIGSVTPDQTRPPRGGGGAGQVRRRTNQVELNGNQTKPTTDLPINPYSLNQLTTPIFRCPSSSSAPAVTSAMMSSAMMSHRVRLSGTKTQLDLNQDWEEQRSLAAAKAHRELRSGAELKERSPCVEERGEGVDPRVKNSSSSSLDTTAETQAVPTSESSSDGQVKQPIRAQLHSDSTSLPERFSSRDESSRLSLRRLFSNVRLSRTRAGSLDRFSIRPRPLDSDPAPSSLMKKCPSAQSLSVGSPFLQLRKPSSVQSFGSEQKKKDRSADYRPAAADRFLQRSLSVEDVSRPCSLRSVGRVLQVDADGTFLLELSRPTNRMYGFIISRGRGRPDSGVYVEDMVDSSTEKLYAGLLSIGDEILEVNGEKVACLSLDQIIHLLTQNTCATVRVLHHLRTPPL